MNSLNWNQLTFSYTKTDYNVRCHYKNGKWGELEVSQSEKIDTHIAATGLHYGQEAFEGMKAFMGRDGKIRLFRWQENAKRLINSACGILMAEVSVELFGQAIQKVVSLNKKYVPPYGSGASLYIRPLLFGNGPMVGVSPAIEYTFLVFVTPVGPYFKEGVKPVDMLISRNYDRAAPLGTGRYKVGGNYASSLKAIVDARKKGYANVIFLDAIEKKYIDECGPANFFAIQGNTYITPDSNTILPSITNKTLIKLAELQGMKTERRQIPITELSEFDEAGACGTAAVISPIAKIDDPDTGKSYIYCSDSVPGEKLSQLYNKLTAIQNGDEADPFNWIAYVD